MFLFVLAQIIRFIWHTCVASFVEVFYFLYYLLPPLLHNQRYISSADHLDHDLELLHRQVCTEHTVTDSVIWCLPNYGLAPSNLALKLTLLFAAIILIGSNKVKIFTSKFGKLVDFSFYIRIFFGLNLVQKKCVLTFLDLNK